MKLETRVLPLKDGKYRVEKDIVVKHEFTVDSLDEVQDIHEFYKCYYNMFRLNINECTKLDHRALKRKTKCLNKNHVNQWVVEEANEITGDREILKRFCTESGAITYCKELETNSDGECYYVYRLHK